MSNKYLEKAAAMFPSKDYMKSLGEEDKEKYKRHYREADISSLKNVAKASGAQVIGTLGTAAGVVAGFAGGRKIGQVLARRALNKNILKGVGKIGDGTYDITDSIRKGIKIHAIAKPIGAVAGGFVGAVPGAIILDRVRHNHAKSVMEKKRKDNE